ncbi:MAG TPA: hypothetical protein VN665_03150 [Candidatus Paceibacterota bacterium]|nr:hypothetical protein [Candidatus Paceibacterota bacterium]
MNKKIYTVLLLLYPKAHRIRFGNEMMQVFEDAYAEAKSKGVLATFWARIISDAVVSAPAERMAELENNLITFMHNEYFKPTISKVILAAVGTVPLFWILTLAFVDLSEHLPHPHVSGVGVLLAFSLIVFVPMIVSATISYVCACGIAAVFKNRHTA